MSHVRDEDLPRREIHLDERLQARSDDGLDEQHVQGMVNDPDELDRLNVFLIDGKYWLVDGHHELDAFRRMGRDVVPCRVHEGTFLDAEKFAWGANARHGKKRTPADVRHVAFAAFAAAARPYVLIPDAEIARLIRISPQRLSELRREWVKKSGSVESSPQTGKCPKQPRDANGMSEIHCTPPDLAPDESEGAAACETARLKGHPDADPDGSVRRELAQALRTLVRGLATLGLYRTRDRQAVERIVAGVFGAPVDRPPAMTRVDRENRQEREKGGRPRTGRAAD